MFDMWSTVTSKLEAHNTAIQTNAQTNNAGQIQSSGSIKGKPFIKTKLLVKIRDKIRINRQKTQISS